MTLKSDSLGARPTFQMFRTDKKSKSLDYGKHLETGKQQNPLNTKSVWKQGNSKFL